MDITKILLLGRGMVARPCVDRNSKNEGTIGELPLPLEWYNLLMTDVRHYYSLTTAQALASSLPRTNAISLDVSSILNLDSAIAVHDLVISLVPHIYYAEIIKLAIKNKVNVVTISYVSPAIRNLDESAKEVGIVVLREVGVDPGVDHLYAIKTISEVHANGGKVFSFRSYPPLPHEGTNKSTTGNRVSLVLRRPSSP